MARHAIFKESLLSEIGFVNVANAFHRGNRCVAVFTRLRQNGCDDIVFCEHTGMWDVYKDSIWQDSFESLSLAYEHFA